VKLSLWSAPDGGKPSFEEAVRQFQGPVETIETGYVFGLSWTNHWVKVELDIPEQVKRARQEVICK
jgi:alpha-mannosidase